MNKWPPDENKLPKAEDGYDDLAYTPKEKAEIGQQAKTDADYNTIVMPNLPYATELDPEIERQEQINKVRESLFGKSKNFIKSIWKNRKNATSPETGPDMDGGSMENYDIVDGRPVLKNKKGALAKMADKITVAKELGGLLMSEGGKPEGLEKKTSKIPDKFVVENGELRLEEKPPAPAVAPEATSHTESHGHPAGAEHHPHTEGHGPHEHTEDANEKLKQELKQHLGVVIEKIKDLDATKASKIKKILVSIVGEEKKGNGDHKAEHGHGGKAELSPADLNKFLNSLRQECDSRDSVFEKSPDKAIILEKITKINNVVDSLIQEMVTLDDTLQGDKANTDAMSYLKKANKEGKEKLEKEIAELKKNVENPEGPDKDQFKLSASRKLLEKISSKNIDIVYSSLGKTIELYKKALKAREDELKQKEQELKEHEEKLKLAIQNKDDAQVLVISKKIEKYEESIWMLKNIIKGSEKKLDEKIKFYKSRTDKRKILAEKEENLIGSENIDDIKKLTEEFEEESKLVEESIEPKKHGHEHGHGHGHHDSLADKIKGWSLVGGGLFAGLFVEFTRQLIDTLREKKGGGGKSHDTSSHGHGGGGGHH